MTTSLGSHIFLLINNPHRPAYGMNPYQPLWNEGLSALTSCEAREHTASANGVRGFRPSHPSAGRESAATTITGGLNCRKRNHHGLWSEGLPALTSVRKDGKAKRINNRGLSVAKPPDTKSSTKNSSAKTGNPHSKARPME